MSQSPSPARRAGPYANQVRRAALPEVLFLPDLAVALGLHPKVAHELLLAGELGPYVDIAGRPAVRRVAFLEALAERETRPSPVSEPSQPHRELGPDG